MCHLESTGAEPSWGHSSHSTEHEGVADFKNSYCVPSHPFVGVRAKLHKLNM
jgi:hypothetical protein